MIEGYDHSYFYVASVMEDHVRWHAARAPRSADAGVTAGACGGGREQPEEEDVRCG